MIPSFVTMPERIALRDYVALNWTGGALVEVGSFCGATAVAILQGMDAAKRPGKLHCYDTFRFPNNEEWAEEYRKRVPGVEGDSFLGVFEDAVGSWTTKVVAQVGEAEGAPLPPPTWLLHLDCALSAEFHRDVSRRFFPLVIPGGVIVQQDWGYDRAPYIDTVMRRLAAGGLVVPIYDVDTSRYYFVRQAIPEEAVEMAFLGVCK